MLHSRHHAYAAVLALSLSLVSCGSGVGNAAPRLTAVPAQTTPGGTVFSLDLAAFVTDPNGDPLTFQVMSGGGSFAGSTYSHTFDTLGTYPVQFKVSDVQGKNATATFHVKVTTAELAVIQQGDNLRLLDTDTRKFLTVTAATGFADTLKATLSTGHVVYERTNGTQRLFVYDPNTPKTHTLGDSAVSNALYAAQTAAGDVLFTRAATATPTDTDLFVWSSLTGQTAAISAVPGVPDQNPFVSSADLVFYESGSPADVYYYDPATDTSTAVATGATAERVRGVLPNGAVVFSRVGAGGEQDLFYFAVGTGVVEIGADLSVTVQNQTKTYRATTSTSVVVFEVTGASDLDLYVWDPATGASTAVAASGVDETFAAVTPLDEVVYNVQTGGGNNDLSIYTHSPSANRVISADAANDMYEGVLSNGDVVMMRESGTGDDLYLYDTSLSSLLVLASASADDYSFDKVLSNDKVAYTLAGGSGGVFVVASPVGPPSPDLVGGPGSVFGGEALGGDIVVQVPSGPEFDLVLWDESASSVVTISAVAGDDSFGAAASNGDIVFLREVVGKTTTDLFIWDPATLLEAQLTDTTVDHGVVLSYSADNS